MRFLSTLPARGATLKPAIGLRYYEISIHAPREGSDSKRITCSRTKPYFYPRSPRGERLLVEPDYFRLRDISIHAPREGSDASISHATFEHPLFLSTLPARGATGRPWRQGGSPGRFLSTLPARGATLVKQLSPCIRKISIHAPREGSDSLC